MSGARTRLEDAERRLFARYAIQVESREVALADPGLRVRVLEAGSGDPVVLIHGSGMLASTWAPLVARLRNRRTLAVDLPGFGLSDRFDYSGRSLREHAVGQLTSLLDALGLTEARLVGTSLGGMWALAMALERPDRVAGVVSLGVPAVALAGMHGDPFFTLATTPVVGAVGVRLKPPTVTLARRAMVDVLGTHAIRQMPDDWFGVVLAGMRMPGYARAMRSHLLLAMRRGRPRPENHFSDAELASLDTPVLFVWGESDVYGPPEIGRRAAAVMPRASVATVPGNHAPFLDDPAHCAELITSFFPAAARTRAATPPRETAAG